MQKERTQRRGHGQGRGRGQRGAIQFAVEAVESRLSLSVTSAQPVRLTTDATGVSSSLLTLAGSGATDSKLPILYSALQKLNASTAEIRM